MFVHSANTKKNSFIFRSIDPPSIISEPTAAITSQCHRGDAHKTKPMTPSDTARDIPTIQVPRSSSGSARPRLTCVEELHGVMPEVSWCLIVWNGGRDRACRWGTNLRVHVREKLQLAGEDFRQKHSSARAAQRLQARLQMLRREKLHSELKNRFT